VKTKVKILAMVIGLYALAYLTSLESCSNDNCPNQTFNTLQDCEYATDGKKCICVKEGNSWKAKLNP